MVLHLKPGTSLAYLDRVEIGGVDELQQRGHQIRRQLWLFLESYNENVFRFIVNCNVSCLESDNVFSSFRQKEHYILCGFFFFNRMEASAKTGNFPFSHVQRRT